MGMKFHDVQLTETWEAHERNKGGFKLAWSSEKGFGEVSFFVRNDGKVVCDNERESPEFIKSLMLALVESSEFKDGWCSK